jgi:uncharacterized damage-inducible protein DinB
MAIAESLLAEFDNEVATTRRVLERVPEDQADWKPHPKSMTLGQLSTHIAELVGWTDMIIKETEFDLEPPGGEPYKSAEFESSAVLLERFDASVEAARTVLGGASDDVLHVTWTLKKGGKTVMAMPRPAWVRTFVLKHVVHHRGQLSVYLRLLDVPVPPIYGPSADEAFG